MGTVGGESHVFGLRAKHFCSLLSDSEYLFRHSHGKLVSASARVAAIAFHCLSNGFCHGRGLGVGGGGVIKVYYASGVYFSHLFCSNITFLNGMRSFSSMAGFFFFGGRGSPRPDFYAVIRFRIRDMFPFISFSICPWYGVFLLHTPRLCTTSMRFRDTSIVSIRLPSIVAESMSESAFR